MSGAGAAVGAAAPGTAPPGGHRAALRNAAGPGAAAGGAPTCWLPPPLPGDAPAAETRWKRPENKVRPVRIFLVVFFFFLFVSILSFPLRLAKIRSFVLGVTRADPCERAAAPTGIYLISTVICRDHVALQRV